MLLIILRCTEFFGMHLLKLSAENGVFSFQIKIKNDQKYKLNKGYADIYHLSC